MYEDYEVWDSVDKCARECVCVNNIEKYIRKFKNEYFTLALD